MGYHPNLALMQRATRPVKDEVERADRHTAMCDLRTGICLAKGTRIEDIDPASGYDHSRRAYEFVRQSWQQQFTMHGFSDEYDRPRYEAARSNWLARRPQWDDDWLSGLDIEYRD